MISYVIISAIILPAYALIGFDCGGQHLNITSISLLDVGGCNLNYHKPNSSEVFVQLLQLSDYTYTEVIQCKVEISRTIYYCGMHSHISVVHNGRADYVRESGYDQCQEMIRHGTTMLANHNIIEGLKVNSTTTHSVILAGRVNTDGTCKGTQYSDPYGTWDDVVVQAVARISLKSAQVPIQLNSGKIILKSGTICTLSDGTCIDSEDGYTFWRPMPTSSCRFEQYDVLYEGNALKIKQDIGNPQSPVIYSLTTQDITFALTKTKEKPLCGYTLSQTEHPKLFILETKKGDTFKRRGNTPIDNLDIFAYMNSKFVYVEKHIRNQMTSLYYNVVQQKCELERQVITNALSFATVSPEEFAYRLMKGPGYMAVTTGEATQIIKCIPVNVVIRRVEECYLELPVLLRNASLFLTPRSRIITKFGTRRECSRELPTMYRVEDTWIQFTPEAYVRPVAPQQLKPMTNLSWSYLTPGSLAVSGIYTEQDIEKLRDHIMFPAEKPALLNSIARGLTGHSTDSNGISMYNLLDEKSLNKIVENTASRIWGGFVTFGSATAGILGILLIIRILKMIIDTAIHGYALHTAYGCSLHLIGAVWSSLTHLLLHLARGPINRKKPDDIEEAPTPPPLPTIPPATTSNLESSPIAKIRSYRRPTMTINTPSINEQNPTIGVNTPISLSYKELKERIDNLEQIPTK